MAVQALQEVFDRFSDLRVLIIGDLMIDSYVYGKVNRISPEAPVPVVNIKDRDRRLGGAANVALNITHLGAHATICGLIGKDEEGEEIKSLLEKNDIASDGLVVSSSRPSTVKERIIAGSQHILRIDSENSDKTTSEEERLILAKIESLISGHDVIIFEDYDKGVINSKIIKSTVQWAREQGKKVVVDPKKRNFLEYSGVDLFKPNLRELKEGLKLDHDIDDNQHIVEAVKTLRRSCSFKKVMITLSDRGIYMNDDHSHHFIHAHFRRISDVSGAGDTVISIAALCEALDIPLTTQAELSNLGGGIVCEYPGVVPIDKDVLFDEARRLNLIIPHD